MKFERLYRLSFDVMLVLAGAYAQPGSQRKLRPICSFRSSWPSSRS